MKKRVRVLYSGRVQGVGFRYMTERIARVLDVSGWVKNLPDGKVEVVAEGEEEKLADFLDEIEKRSLQPYVHSAEIKWKEHKDEFKGFGIRH